MQGSILEYCLLFASQGRLLYIAPILFGLLLVLVKLGLNEPITSNDFIKELFRIQLYMKDQRNTKNTF